METIPEEPGGEDEESKESWTIDANGLGATRPGNGEVQPAPADYPQALAGDPDAVPRQRAMQEEQEDRRKHKAEQLNGTSYG